MSSYRLLDIATHIQERWGVPYTLSALSKLLRRMGLSWRRRGLLIPRAAPRHGSYIKNLTAELAVIAAAHSGKVVQVWCEDEAREGQNGRTGHRWFTRGERPPGRCDKRFLSTYIFAAVRPGSDDAFALVLPEAKAVTMDLFLAGFAETLPASVPAVLLLDQAGWHGKAALHVPENVALVHKSANALKS